MKTILYVGDYLPQLVDNILKDSDVVYVTMNEPQRKERLSCVHGDILDDSFIQTVRELYLKFDKIYYVPSVNNDINQIYYYTVGIMNILYLAKNYKSNACVINRVSDFESKLVKDLRNVAKDIIDVYSSKFSIECSFVERV